MKPEDQLQRWQQGFPLEELRLVQRLFGRYEQYSYGRFSVPNEAAIAGMLASGDAYLLTVNDELVGVMDATVVKRDRSRRDFAGRRLQLKQGDFQIRHLTYREGVPDAAINEHLLQYAGNRSVWAEVHSEDRERVRMLERLGFQVVASRISAASELFSLLLRSNRPGLRMPEPLHPAHLATLTQLSPRWLSDAELAAITAEIEQNIEGWANHYSSYNLRNSWSAVSLRGFSPDPEFIIKPSEMSKRWKDANRSLLSAPVVDTPMMRRFPTIESLCSRLGMSLQRVRLMRVRAGDGGLSRHADITDREAGPMPGQVARLHIPIISDEACRFQAWNLSGEQLEHHLPEGSLWYLDTRKPHAVSNAGATRDRIHLVIDAVCEPYLTDVITRASRQ